MVTLGYASKKKFSGPPSDPSAAPMYEMAAGPLQKMRVVAGNLMVIAWNLRVCNEKLHFGLRKTGKCGKMRRDDAALQKCPQLHHCSANSPNGWKRPVPAPADCTLKMRRITTNLRCENSKITHFFTVSEIYMNKDEAYMNKNTRINASFLSKNHPPKQEKQQKINNIWGGGGAQP